MNEDFYIFISFKGNYNYQEAIQKSNLFFWAQRSGKLPAAADKLVAWRGDSGLNDVGLQGENLSGGYYDGEDYKCIICIK